MNSPIVDGRMLKRGDMLFHTDKNWHPCERGWVEFMNDDHEIGLVQVRCKNGAVPVVKLSNLQWEAMTEQQEIDEFYAELSAGNKLTKSALCHIREQNTEIESLRAKLHSLQGAGDAIQVEAVAITREDEDGELYLEWTLEGGISALEFADQVLLIAHGDVTGENGSGEVYTRPADPDMEFVPRELLRRILSCAWSVADPALQELRAILSSKGDV